MRALCVLGAALWLVACGEATTGAWAGPSLLTLRGVLLEDPGRTAAQPIRVSLLWGADEVTPPRVDRTFTSPWPVQFELAVTSLPQASALSPTVDGGRGGTATLVAWVDGNDNGVLDRSTAEQLSPDRVVGSARSPNGSGLVLAYFEGALPRTPMGLQRGFNLVDLDAGVMAFSTPVSLVLSSDPRLGEQLCPNDVSCPAPELETLSVSGSLGLATGTGAVDLEVRDARGPLRTAVVKVNGRAVPRSGERYSLRETGSFVRAGQDSAVSVEAPGYRSLSIEVPIPGAFTLLSPAFGAVVSTSESLEVSWSSASGATNYDVQLYGADFTALYSTTTTSTSVVIPPQQIGSLLLVVSARGSTIESIYPYVNLSQRVEVR